MINCWVWRISAFDFNASTRYNKLRPKNNNYSSQIKFYSKYFGAQCTCSYPIIRSSPSHDDGDEGDNGIRIFPLTSRLPSNAQQPPNRRRHALAIVTTNGECECTVPGHRVISPPPDRYGECGCVRVLPSPRCHRLTSVYSSRWQFALIRHYNVIFEQDLLSRWSG